MLVMCNGGGWCKDKECTHYFVHEKDGKCFDGFCNVIQDHAACVEVVEVKDDKGGE